MQKKLCCWLLLSYLIFTILPLSVNSLEESEVTTCPRSADSTKPANVTIGLLYPGSAQNIEHIYIRMNISQEGKMIDQNVIINLSAFNENTPNMAKNTTSFTYFYNFSLQLYVGLINLTPSEEFEGKNVLNFTVISTINQFADTTVICTITLTKSEGVYLPIFAILILNILGLVVVLLIIIKIIKPRWILKKSIKNRMTQDDNRKILEEHEQVMQQLERKNFHPNEFTKKTETKP